MSVTKYIQSAPGVYRVGAYDYQLIIFPNFIPAQVLGRSVSDPAVWGAYRPNSKEILLAGPEVQPSTAHVAGTLLHELLHAIWYEFGVAPVVDIPDPHLLEEQYVLRLETGLMTLYQANPDFLPWFKKGLA